MILIIKKKHFHHIKSVVFIFFQNSWLITTLGGFHFNELTTTAPELEGTLFAKRKQAIVINIAEDHCITHNL